MHGVYKPGNVKLRPDILAEGQKVAAAKLGLPEGSKPFDFVFHGGSGSLKSEIEDSLKYGVVKMNVDTDTQYAFTRPFAGHMFANYDGVLKVDGEVGNKKAYDPRSYLKKAEASMTERVIEACNDLHSAGRSTVESRSRSSLAAGCLADLPLIVAELQVEAARRRVCGAYAMNVVTLASAWSPLTTTWSMLATTGYCLAAATRAWVSAHARSS